MFLVWTGWTPGIFKFLVEISHKFQENFVLETSEYAWSSLKESCYILWLSNYALQLLY